MAPRTRIEMNSDLVRLATELLKIKLCILDPRRRDNRPQCVAHILDSIHLTEHEIICELYAVFCNKSAALHAVFNEMIVWLNQYASVRSMKENCDDNALLCCHQQEMELKHQIIRALFRRDSIETSGRPSEVDADAFPPVQDEEYGSYCLALLQTEPFLPAEQ